MFITKIIFLFLIRKLIRTVNLYALGQEHYSEDDLDLDSFMNYSDGENQDAVEVSNFPNFIGSRNSLLTHEQDQTNTKCRLQEKEPTLEEEEEELCIHEEEERRQDRENFRNHWAHVYMNTPAYWDDKSDTEKEEFDENIYKQFFRGREDEFFR